MVDVIYGVTLTREESIETFKENINYFLFNKINTKFIINTNKDLNYFEKDYDNLIVINNVGDMKKSRHSLLNEFKKYDSKIYMLFDSDILIPNELDILSEIEIYKNYDFITLYYKGDPPIPAFFTLASSLNDYYNQINKSNKSAKEVWFDDSDIENPTYFYPNSKISKKSLSDVIRGKSFARDINKFASSKDENDFISGGSTIYFNKEALVSEYEWPKYKNKSLIWYDSFRTYMMKKEGFKHAKVPIFLEHKRHNNSISLNWDSVISYIEGYNYLYSSINKDHVNELMLLRAVELFYYQKGLLNKILNLDENLIKNDKLELEIINNFLNEDSKLFIDYCKEKEWK